MWNIQKLTLNASKLKTSSVILNFVKNIDRIRNSAGRLSFRLDSKIISKQTDMTVLSQTSTRNGYSIVFVHSLNRMSILSLMNTWNVHLAILTLITMTESYRQSGAVVSTSSVTVNSAINWQI